MRPGGISTYFQIESASSRFDVPLKMVSARIILWFYFQPGGARPNRGLDLLDRVGSVKHGISPGIRPDRGFERAVRSDPGASAERGREREGKTYCGPGLAIYWPTISPFMPPSAASSSFFSFSGTLNLSS